MISMLQCGQDDLLRLHKVLSFTIGEAQQTKALILGGPVYTLKDTVNTERLFPTTIFILT